MARLLKKRREKKQAAEAARKAELQKLRDENRAKRAKRDAERAALAEAKKAKGPGMSGLPSAEESAKKSAEMRKFRESEKQKQAATKRGLSNIKARREAAVGEAYKRTEATGEVRTMRKTDPAKKSKKNEPTYTDKFGNYDPSQLSSNMTTEQKDRASREKLAAEKEARALNPKAFNPDGSRKTIERGQHSITKYGSQGKQTFRSKPGESLDSFRKRIGKEKQMAKHGGALAIMIAPVKTKKMKAVKKAPGGASMKKMSMYKDGGKITKKQKAEMDAKAKKLQKDSKPKNPLLSTPKVKSSKRGKAVQAKEGPAEKATSGPRLVKYYMSKAGGGMSREQAVAKMVRARTGKIPSDDGKSMVKQPKMMYGGGIKKTMSKAKKKKAMYGSKVGMASKGSYMKK